MRTESEGGADRPPSVWMRGLLMLAFGVAFGAGQFVLNMLTVVQFLWLLFTGAPNQLLAGFGRSLSAWLADVARFMTCASDEKPFPWRPWPGA